MVDLTADKMFRCLDGQMENILFPKEKTFITHVKIDYTM